MMIAKHREIITKQIKSVCYREPNIVRKRYKQR